VNTIFEGIDPGRRPPGLIEFGASMVRYTLGERMIRVEDVVPEAERLDDLAKDRGNYRVDAQYLLAGRVQVLQPAELPRVGAPPQAGQFASQSLFHGRRSAIQ